MKVAIYSFSANGKSLAEKIAKEFEKLSYTCEKYNKLASVKECFSSCKLLVFVSATGIAVRGIAPFVMDKTTDPAVVCLDDLGENVISLLSGHIGGGNDFALQIAKIVGGRAIITTATDKNGKFACDSFAKKNSMKISSMKMAKLVSAEILNRDIPMISDFEILGKAGGINLVDSVENLKNSQTEIGIYVGYGDISPFKNTLRLTPKCLSVGIGCRRGVPFEKLKQALFDVFSKNNLDVSAISQIASIKLKSDEVGILELAKFLDVESVFYTASELESVCGEFESSDFVKSITGVSNVCERASMACGNARLIVKKTPCDGVTIAVAVIDKKFEIGG